MTRPPTGLVIHVGIWLILSATDAAARGGHMYGDGPMGRYGIALRDLANLRRGVTASECS